MPTISKNEYEEDKKLCYDTPTIDIEPIIEELHRGYCYAKKIRKSARACYQKKNISEKSVIHIVK